MSSQLLQRAAWELACGFKVANAGAVAWVALDRLASLNHNSVTGATQRHAYAGTSGSGRCELSSTAVRLPSSTPLVASHLAPASSSSGGSAHLHSAAADEAASDDDTRLLVYNSSQLFQGAYAPGSISAEAQQHAGHHHHHHAGHASHINSSHTAAKQHHHHHHSSLNHTSHSHHRHHQPVQGHLHAAHPRRHAASSSSSSSQGDALSELLLSCKAMGGLRRIMLKFKANMGPEQVANTLLALQHLVREARQRRSGDRQQLQHPAEEEYEQQRRWWASGVGARVQPRVRAAQEFNRATARAAESDGPQDQLIAQMLGELGNMIWHMMGDMSGADLAKLLYSWAMLSWHPEQQLLADVTASFLAAAIVRPERPASSDSNHQQQQQQLQQQEAAPTHLEGAAEPWLAAGLWGLAKLGEPLTGPTLKLLLQRYHDLLHLWSPQQLADIAWALAAAADEQVAAEVVEGQAGEGLVEAQQEQLLPVVLGLGGRLVEIIQQQQQSEASNAQQQRFAGSSGSMDAVWPELLLQQSAAAHRAAQHAELVAGGPTAPAALHDAPQLAWRMLQALAAVGVDVSEPDGPAGGLVAALSAAMQPAQPQW